MPSRYAAFMRGINLGGRRASGADLVAAFEETRGIVAAASFIASGNVVFEDETRRRPATIAAAIERSIHERFGWESRVLLRNEKEVEALAAAQPFSAEQLAASKGKPQIILFDREIDARDEPAIAALAPAGDVLVTGARELHWLPSAGLADNALDVKALDRLLGTGTTRTANTIRRLHAKFFS